MRPAALALLAVGVTVGALGACGGAAGTSNPLDQREPASSGMDPAPSSTDTPPSTYETPPSNTEAPPSSGEGANSCISCSGTYTCSGDGDEGSSVTITLKLSNGACGVSAGGNVVASGVPSCETGGASSITVDGVTVSVTRGPGAGFTVCEDSADGGMLCATCTPTSAGTSPAQDGGGVGVMITGASGCSALSACCANLSGSEQTTCEQVVSAGDDTTCTSTLDDLQGIGTCS